MTRRPILLGLVLAASLANSVAVAQPSQDCSVATVGVDMAHAQYVLDGIFRKGVGQTFLARDTLIRSITAYRTFAQDSSVHPVKLWITRMAPEGYPDVYPGPGVLYESPGQIFTGDGVHHVPLRFEFDPPFALPGPGQYAFFYQTCSFTIDLMATQPLGPDTLPDRYLEGQAWLTGRNFTGCYLQDPLPQYETAVNDLIFTIEFCHDVVTTVPRTTWGELKSKYRGPSRGKPPADGATPP